MAGGQCLPGRQLVEMEMPVDDRPGAREDLIFRAMQVALRHCKRGVTAPICVLPRFSARSWPSHTRAARQGHGRPAAVSPGYKMPSRPARTSAQLTAQAALPIFQASDIPAGRRRTVILPELIIPD